MFQIHKDSIPSGWFPIRAEVTNEIGGKVFKVGTIGVAGLTPQGVFDNDIVTVLLDEKLDELLRAYLINSHHGYNFNNDTIQLYPQEYEVI